MKRVIIVVEGQTEQEFVNSLLAPYLRGFGILNATPVLIRTSRSGHGGMINYQHFANTVKMQLRSSKTDFVVTSFIDFFRLPNTMPEYDKSMSESDDVRRVEALEAAMNKDISDGRFFSYVQLHEFEALLFSDNRGFESYFPEKVFRQTLDIIARYENPEDINSSPEGAPSKRLLRITPEYNKVLEGNLVALEIGFETILNKCPRFAAWVHRIVEMCG